MQSTSNEYSQHVFVENWGKLSPIITKKYSLTFILLFTTTPTFANSVDPDQMASEETI